MCGSRGAPRPRRDRRRSPAGRYGLRCGALPARTPRVHDRGAAPLSVRGRRRCAVARGDAHVVDHEFAGEGGVAVGVAGPVAADRQVEDEEERLVERPGVAVRVGRGAVLVDVSVDRPGDGVGGPVDGEGVEVVGEGLAVGQGVAGPDAAGAGVAGPVQGAVHGGGLEADVLHDVDLTGVGPPDLSDVVTEHPEGGPHALAARDLHARLDVAIGLRELAGGVQPRGGVLAGAVPALVVGAVLLARGDDQMALAVERGVVVAGGVVLPFVVVDVVAGLDLPLAAVHGRTGRTVELVRERRRGGGDRFRLPGGARRQAGRGGDQGEYGESGDQETPGPVGGVHERSFPCGTGTCDASCI